MAELDASRLIIHDTAPIVDGASVRQSLERSIELAQLGDRLGYKRYWTAETHGMRAVASCSPAVLCAEVACRTAHIKVGAAGVLLPHHSALVVSEQFGTLEALHPGRIDLALGRSAGGPRAAADAINSSRDHSTTAFSRQIDQLRSYFEQEYHENVRSVTGYGHEPTLWLLGTTPESAKLAAEKKLPYVFGGHLNHEAMETAIKAYRVATSAAEGWSPYLAVSVGVIAAADPNEAEFLAGSHRLKVMSRKMLGKRMFLPSPAIAAERRPTDPDQLREFNRATAGFILGTGETVRKELANLVAWTGADEVILSTPVFDHATRLRSYALAVSAPQTAAT